mmetsp:Transcript_122313/g.182782  ORF Transcript_122313/g.182782 Transcript_122313/m.182782 type:complete len:104 (+) Transcript_122313:195-506(+)
MDRDDAEYALKEDGREINGLNIKVEISEKKDRDGGGRDGGRSFGGRDSRGGGRDRYDDRRGGDRGGRGGFRGGGDRGGGDRDRKGCFNCGGFGHIARDCSRSP